MIRIRNLHKSLGGRPVLRGVDLDVHAGEILALVGPSGAGKSVLLKHMVGLLLPDRGDVLVDGVSMVRAGQRELSAVRKRLGYVFQDGALLDSLTIRENLKVALHDQHVSKGKSVDGRILDALELVSLDSSVLEKRPKELSGGMRKRVAVARSVIRRPRVILYDEPTTGLDPRNVATMADLVLRTRDRLNTTSLIVSHDLSSLRRIADRFVLIEEGRIRFCGSTWEFFSTDDPLVASFRSYPAPDAAEVA